MENKDMNTLRQRCLALAEDLSDNGICWAPEEDTESYLAELTEDNLEDIAWKIADNANWFN
jgi:hypothetical protein